MEYLKTALKLVATKGLGCRRILKLASMCSDINDVYKYSLDELETQGKLDKATKKILVTGHDQDIVDNILNTLGKSHFKVTTIFDRDYPVLLKKIYDPPIVLFINGDVLPEDHDAIAVVGTRVPSAYGKSVTESLVKELANNQMTIVSGMARGTDSCAHKSAVAHNARTIAVLGNGIDITYPPENRNLKNQIVENGCCCSEFPFGTRPNSSNFPRRNRIISGMSLGTIVIEAGRKSGAVLTAFNALDQNREVFAVPGRIFDSKSYGTNFLIQKGAKLVSGIDSILEEIDTLRKFSQRKQQVELKFNFTIEEKKVYDLLENSLHVDEIATRLNKNISLVLGTLLTMELKGLIRQYPGKIFARME